MKSLLMRICLFLSVFLFTMNLWAKESLQSQLIEDLKAEIFSSYALTVEVATKLCDVTVTEHQFLQFLDDFSQEAQRQELKRRFLPRITKSTIVLFPEEGCYSYFSESSDGSTRHLEHLRRYKIGTRWDAAEDAVKFLIENFPLYGTPEAAEFQLRDRAIEKAIVDIVTELRESCEERHFFIYFNIDSVSGYFSLTSPQELPIPVREKFLRGLLNHKSTIKEANQCGIPLLRSIDTWYEYAFSRSDGEYIYDSGEYDEGKTEEVIARYMEQLENQ